MIDCERASNWVRCKLGDALSFEYGKALKKEIRNEAGPFNVYGSSGIVGKHDEPLVDGPAVVVGRKGSVGSVFYSESGFWPIDTTYYVNPPECFDAKFVAHYLSFLRLSELDTSTAVPGLNRNDAYRVQIGIPPLNEQRRIVAKIEELFSELDKGVESLKIARAQLKTYRQSLLKAAFEGRLTEQWRRDNADKLASADQILESIREERESQYQQQLAEWRTAVTEWEADMEAGKKPRKPKALKAGGIGGSDAIPGLPVLPDKWDWSSAEALIDSTPYSLGIGPFGSNLKVSDYAKRGVPLVFVRNITQRNFDKEQRYVSTRKAEELYAHQALPGDILITKMGDPPGDAAIYPEGRPMCVITADCLKFRVNSSFFDRRFVCHFINSFFAKAQLGLITRGVAQKKISVERFKSVIFPVLSLDEQTLIVRKLEENLSQVEKIEAIIEGAVERSEALRQSILKRAFEGKLVLQDPDDEPASALLERIRQEQADAHEPKRRKRKTEAPA